MKKIINLKQKLQFKSELESKSQFQSEENLEKEIFHLQLQLEEKKLQLEKIKQEKEKPHYLFRLEESQEIIECDIPNRNRDNQCIVEKEIYFNADPCHKVTCFYSSKIIDIKTHVIFCNKIVKCFEDELEIKDIFCDNLISKHSQLNNYIFAVFDKEFPKEEWRKNCIAHSYLKFQSQIKLPQDTKETSSIDEKITFTLHKRILFFSCDDGKKWKRYFC